MPLLERSKRGGKDRRSGAAGAQGRLGQEFHEQLPEAAFLLLNSIDLPIYILFRKGAEHNIRAPYTFQPYRLFKQASNPSRTRFALGQKQDIRGRSCASMRPRMRPRMGASMPIMMIRMACNFRLPAGRRCGNCHKDSLHACARDGTNTHAISCILHSSRRKKLRPAGFRAPSVPRSILI